MYEVLAVVVAVLAVVCAAAGMYVAASHTSATGDDQLAQLHGSATAKVLFALPFFAGGGVFAIVAIAFSVLARG